MTDDSDNFILDRDKLWNELKEKIKLLNPNLTDESVLEEIVEKSVDLIILKKCTYNQCMQIMADYFNKDFQSTKLYVDFLCEKTNIPLKYEIPQLSSILVIPDSNTDYIPFQSEHPHLTLKRKRTEDNATEINLLEDLKQNEKEHFSLKNSFISKQEFFEKKSQLNFSSLSTYSSYMPNNSFYQTPLIENYNFPNHIIVEEQPLRRIYYFNGNEINKDYKIKIKCKDWLNCKTINCPYIHPKEMCPFFPKCKFGDKCFYIHPLIECKFGKNCNKNDCPYAHPK